MHYNYVIFGSSSENYKAAYSDLDSLPGVKYFDDSIYSNTILGKCIRNIQRVHTSDRISNHIHLPLQSIWNRFMFRNPFVDAKPICFVFFSTGMRTTQINSNLIEFLRKRYKGAKFVVFYQDLVSKKRRIDISVYKKCMDLLITFDHGDAVKYGMLYHPLVYSKIRDSIHCLEKKSDIYFLGKAKDRFEEIIRAYEQFKSKGFVCDFILVDVPMSKRVYSNEICYCDGISYRDNLRHVKSAKCLLEIMQKGGCGFTQRTCEAIAFGKHLISNNVLLRDAPFFSPERISIYDSSEELRELNLGSISKTVDYQYIDKLSPIELINFLEYHLQE